MAENTEQIILEAARKHFVQKGYAATRMQEIADEAGINKALLHYYFRSKEKLFDQIVTQSLDKLFPSIAQALSTKGSVKEKIEGIVHSYIQTLVAHPDIPFFIMSELAQKRESFLLEIKKRAGHFTGIPSFLVEIQQAMDAGEIKSMPPVHLLLNVMGMCVFPFMAKPIFCNVMELPEDQFNQLMEERAKIVTDFIYNAINT